MEYPISSLGAPWGQRAPWGDSLHVAWAHPEAAVGTRGELGPPASPPRAFPCTSSCHPRASLWFPKEGESFKNGVPASAAPSHTGKVQGLLSHPEKCRSSCGAGASAAAGGLQLVGLGTLGAAGKGATSVPGVSSRESCLGHVSGYQTFTSSEDKPLVLLSLGGNAAFLFTWGKSLPRRLSTLSARLLRTAGTVREQGGILEMHFWPHTCCPGRLRGGRASSQKIPAMQHGQAAGTTEEPGHRQLPHTGTRPLPINNPKAGAWVADPVPHWQEDGLGVPCVPPAMSRGSGRFCQHRPDTDTQPSRGATTLIPR